MLVSVNGGIDMVRYIYRCDECMTGFEALSLHADAEAPRLATCPVCQSAQVRLVLVKDPTAGGPQRPPGTGCCGTPGSN